MSDVSRDNLGEQLSAYLDGELSEAEAREVRTLLAGSAAARTRLAELREVSERLRNLPRVAAPTALAEVRERWEPQQTIFGRVPRGWRIVMWLQSGVGVAACVGLFFLGLLAGWNARRLVEIPAQPTAVVPTSSLEAARYKERALDGSRDIAPAAPLTSEAIPPAVVTNSFGAEMQANATREGEARRAVAPDERLAATEVSAVSDPTVRITLAPGTQAEYRHQVETLERWSAGTQQPPLVNAGLGIPGEQSTASGRFKTETAAPVVASDLREQYLYLPADQASRLIRELSPQHDPRVQVDAQAEQMTTIEQVLAAGRTRDLPTDSANSLSFRAPPGMASTSAPILNSPDRPSQPMAASSRGNKKPSGTAGKPAAARKLDDRKSSPPPPDAAELAKSSGAPAEKPAPASGPVSRPNEQDEVAGPPWPPVQPYVALRFTLLPPVEEIEREAASEPAGDE